MHAIECLLKIDKVDAKRCVLILLGTESRVIPLQLPQLPRSPFFGSVNMRPLVKPLGIITSSSQIFQKRSVNNLDVVLISALKRSAWSESIPGAFPFFMLSVSKRTSATPEGLVSISRYDSELGWRVCLFLCTWPIKDFFKVLDPSSS